MKGFSIFVAVVMSFALAVPVFGGVGSGIADNGTHFNLNIIGVPKGKKVDMTDSQRHTIFVPLNTEGYVDGKVTISYVRNTADPTKFEVLDGNATDTNGAIIAVPYEFCTDLNAGCEELLSYNVYAVALGKPGADGAIVEAHCTYDTNVVPGSGPGPGDTCEDTLLMGSFSLKRETGSPKPTPITDIFRATGCLDLGGLAGVCDKGDLAFSNIWIFNIPNLTSYFWDYTNDGLKLMQVRFYPTTSGSIGYVK